MNRVVAGGGLTRNTCLMQVYADVLGREVAVCGTEHASALGAAILGAVAAGKEAGGHGSITEAIVRMAPQPARTYSAVPQHVEIYSVLYREYLRLYDYFGKENGVMKVLRRLRKDRTEAPQEEGPERGDALWR